MEAKKTTTRAAAAMAALCVLLALMLSTTMPGKAAAAKDFCKCYLPCYTECRKTIPGALRFVCAAKCLDDCSPNKKLLAGAGAGGDPCTRACSVNSICNSLEPAGPAPDSKIDEQPMAFV